MSFSPRRLRPRRRTRPASAVNETSRQTSRRLPSISTGRDARVRTDPVDVDEVENHQVEEGNRNHDVELIGNGNDMTDAAEEVSFIDLTEDTALSPVRVNREDSPFPGTPGHRRLMARSPAMVFNDVEERLLHFQNFVRVHQFASAMDTTVDLTESPDECNESVDESLNLNENEVTNDNSKSEGGLSLQCPVCLRSLQTLKRRGCGIVSTMCGHLFCCKCLPQSLRNDGRCPTCRKLLGMTGYHQVFI